MNKFEMQDAQYAYPYHYLPHIDKNGALRVGRSLDWGAEYLCYMTWVARSIAQIAPDSLLDFGCGDGRLLSIIGSGVPIKRGVDLSEKALSIARTFNPSCTFTPSLKEDEKFDAIACVETLEHVPDEQMEAVVATLVQALRPGGHLVITVPSVARKVHPKHYRHYDEAMVRNLFHGKLECITIQWIYRCSGIASVLRMGMVNSAWTVNSSILCSIWWRYVEARLMCAPANTGAHIGAIYRKMD